jgi:hypothetical protein
LTREIAIEIYFPFGWLWSSGTGIWAHSALARQGSPPAHFAQLIDAGAGACSV